MVEQDSSLANVSDRQQLRAEAKPDLKELWERIQMIFASGDEPAKNSIRLTVDVLYDRLQQKVPWVIHSPDGSCQTVQPVSLLALDGRNRS